MRISEMLAFLKPVEAAAQAAYTELAARCADRPRLAFFLQQLARDEATHLELLRRAEEQLRETGQDSEASILLRDSTAQAMRSLPELVDRERTGRLTERDLLDGIVRAEFSEWNEVFLYVLAQFRHGLPDFQRFAAVVHQHKRHIEDYLAACPVDVRPPAAPLPRVWDERLLVVDDEEALRLLLQEFLSDLGTVAVAANGAEALAQTRESFFDVIITDIDMPVMNGLDFYRAVAGNGSPDRSRFIFVTGRGAPVVTQLAHQTGTPLLLKPFSLDTLRETVVGVLNQPN
jgi:two-component system chemotaxis response regulator CheY